MINKNNDIAQEDWGFLKHCIYINALQELIEQKDNNESYDKAALNTFMHNLQTTNNKQILKNFRYSKNPNAISGYKSFKAMFVVVSISLVAIFIANFYIASFEETPLGLILVCAFMLFSIISSVLTLVFIYKFTKSRKNLLYDMVRNYNKQEQKL